MERIDPMKKIFTLLLVARVSTLGRGRSCFAAEPKPNIVIIMVDDMGYGDRALMPPTNEIAEHHNEGLAPIQGEFWKAGGIAPDVELKNVLPHFTDEAVAVIKDHATSSRAKPLLLYFAPRCEARECEHAKFARD